MLVESMVRSGTSNQVFAIPPARLDTVLASAEEALARAAESLRQAPKARVRAATRLPLYAIAFDAVVLERYPEHNQQ